MKEANCLILILLMIFQHCQTVHQGLQGLVSTIGKVSGHLGLSINDKKTKSMLSCNHQLPYDVLISQDKVEVIKDLTHLASSINNQGTMAHEISCKIAKACTAFNQHKIWMSEKFTLKTKFYFLNANVLSTCEI